jgi:hypothetical protein
MVFSWVGSKRSPDVIDNIIFLNLMLADLIQAIGLWVLGYFLRRTLISDLWLSGDLPIIKWMANEVGMKIFYCMRQNTDRHPSLNS